jgi:hypothetical protein
MISVGFRFGGLFSRRSVGSRASLPLLVSYLVMMYRNDDCWRPIEGPVPAVSLNSLGRVTGFLHGWFGSVVTQWFLWRDMRA